MKKDKHIFFKIDAKLRFLMNLLIYYMLKYKK